MNHNNLVCPIEGWIDSVEQIVSKKNEKLFKHTITVAAESPREFPSTYHVISHRQIAPVDSEVSIFVKVKGWISKYKKVQKNDKGENEERTYENFVVSMREIVLPA